VRDAPSPRLPRPQESAPSQSSDFRSERRSASSCSHRGYAESSASVDWANFASSRPIRNLLRAGDTINKLFSAEQVFPGTGYTPRKCRATRPGNGGAPVCPARPPCGPPQRRPAYETRGHHVLPKTERWREAGQVRWPSVNDGERPPDREEVIPFRRTVENAQEFWGTTLWSSSLRERGANLDDPLYSNIGGNVKDLAEEWLKCRREVPYSGSTVSGAVALPREHNPKRWVDRPVAAGKYSMDHMGGTRYAWDSKPRPCLTELEAEVALPAVDVAAASRAAATRDSGNAPLWTARF